MGVCMGMTCVWTIEFEDVECHGLNFSQEISKSMAVCLGRELGWQMQDRSRASKLNGIVVMEVKIEFERSNCDEESKLGNFHK